MFGKRLPPEHMDLRRPTDKRILLFGSEGFIGGHIHRRLLSTHNVVAPPQSEVDITCPERIRKLIHKDDIVVNAAGYADATDRTRRGKRLFELVNVEGVRNLVDVSSEVGIRQFVHISSVSAIPRDSPAGQVRKKSRRSSNPYASSKAEGEHVLQEYWDRVPITVLRPTSVFGEGRGLAVSLCKILSMKIVPVPAGGKSKIPFTYIENIVDCVELCLDDPACFRRAFVIGDEYSYSLKDILWNLAQGIGKCPVFMAVPRPIAYFIGAMFEVTAKMFGRRPIIDRDRMDTLCLSAEYSIKDFQDATGYVPRVSMPDAAMKLGRWFLVQGCNSGRPRTGEVH